MQSQPLYRSNVKPAFELRYSWTGWPSRPPFPADASVLDGITGLWEKDGLRLLERYWADDKVHLTFSATPEVSPVFLAGRVKGRLDHAFRKASREFPGLSRKLSVTSVGHNTREQVEAYVASQVIEARFVDPAFRALMHEFTVVDETADLSMPTEAAHGRYWYNLHVVLVTVERWRVVDRQRLAKLREVSQKIAEKKGYRISRLSVMPDHLHVALRGDIQQSPRAIAQAFQNNLAYSLGQEPIWKETFYTGTFGEYDMWAIRGKESS